MSECRICLENNSEEQLISPCACDGTSKWVHESCLQRWREENVGHENSRRCEICNTPYLIEREYALETYTTLHEGFGLCGELWFGGGIGWVLGGFMWALDSTTNYMSIKVFQIQRLSLRYRMSSDDWLSWSYYQGLSVWSISCIAFLLLLIKIHPNVKRKRVYYSNMLCTMIFTLLSINSFLFVLYTALLSTDANVISWWGPITAVVQLHVYFNYRRCHNKTLITMNCRNIGERILSVQDNPLLYRRARRFEIEDMV